MTEQPDWAHDADAALRHFVAQSGRPECDHPIELTTLDAHDRRLQCANPDCQATWTEPR